jgi:hypothetical protein
MKKTWTMLALIPLAAASVYACGGTDEEEEGAAGYEDVIYQGTVTDEAMVALGSALDQKAPADVPSQAPTLDAPTGMTVPKTPIPTFTWHVGGMTQRSPMEPAGPRLLEVPGTPRGEHGARWLAPLAELLGPVRAANAHGTPFTGTATWLVFSTESNAKLTRVLTSDTKYTPDQAVWDKMVAAGKPITLTLVGAVFADNRVAQDGGPFKGSTLTFTIQ